MYEKVYDDKIAQITPNVDTFVIFTRHFKTTTRFKIKNNFFERVKNQ